MFFKFLPDNLNLFPPFILFVTVVADTLECCVLFNNGKINITIEISISTISHKKKETNTSI